MESAVSSGAGVMDTGIVVGFLLIGCMNSAMVVILPLPPA
jgi:hypothetical protein